MRIKALHGWDLDYASARDLQKELACQVVDDRPIVGYETIAAADVSYDRKSPVLYGAVVLCRADNLELIERVGVAGPATFPYIPGLLSFREAPALLEAFSRLKNRPDVVLCDGQGFAHPRRFGVACHLGLWLDLPTIGCAKSRLCGEFEEPAPARGSRSRLTDHDELIGSVVRTRDGVKPLFVSVGHLCDLDSAVAVVLASARKYRLPAPARMAHDFVNEIRLAAKNGGPIPA